MIRDGAEPIEVGKHFLFRRHDRLDALGDGEQGCVSRRDGQLPRDFLDDRIARVGDRVDGVAEADDDLLAGEPLPDIGLGFVRRPVALLDFERHLVGPTVLRAAERANRPP
ncbi:MAG: hypothetical protein WDM96_10990 [Lacunisphaera sp.]